jgi:Ssp1 endopeptidase immunity protein Rap1a
MRDCNLPPPDGGDLVLSCKAEVEGFDAGYCLGVVEGVIASMKVCKQDRSAITLGEEADATEKYLASHPEKLKERDVVLARKALSKAYPCGGSEVLLFRSASHLSRGSNAFDRPSAP